MATWWTGLDYNFAALGGVLKEVVSLHLYQYQRQWADSRVGARCAQKRITSAEGIGTFDNE